MNDYVCSRCGAGAYYDGRCGDGPVLMCGCDRIGGRWVKDRLGGYHTNPTGARAVDAADVDSSAQAYWDDVEPRR